MLRNVLLSDSMLILHVKVNAQYVVNKLVFILLWVPPPCEPSGRVLASSAGGPGFNPQSRTVSYQRRCKNGTSSALV